MHQNTQFQWYTLKYTVNTQTKLKKIFCPSFTGTRTNLHKPRKFYKNSLHYLEGLLPFTKPPAQAAGADPTQATPPNGLINQFSKIAETFEPIMQFWYPLRLSIYKKKCKVVHFMTQSTISNDVGVTHGQNRVWYISAGNELKFWLLL